MKKLGLLLLVLVASLALVGCNNSEYKVDGEFTAYEVTVSRNAPQVTMVTVTIEKGKIVGYNIDVRQGNVTQTAGDDEVMDTDDDKYTYAWNEKTKKELGDDYGMAKVEGQLEWYEQAALIEAYWLENGVDSVTVNAETNVIDNVAGVTIKDGGYIALAAASLELAKAGNFQALLCTADDLYTATMTVSEKGVVSALQLDVLQGKPVGATFAWAEKTKQELGDDYGMAKVEGQLEWYEQANAITDYVLANGWNADLQPVGANGVSLDGTTIIDSLSGVTIKTQGYFDVLADLFASPAEGEVK